jgi:hypothetical protein
VRKKLPRINPRNRFFDQPAVEKLTKQIDSLEPIAWTENDRGEKFDQLCAHISLVPGEKDCERIIRYEAHLDRTRAAADSEHKPEQFIWALKETRELSAMQPT